MNLGLSYENGEGVEKNLTKAIELFTLSGNQGHASFHWIVLFSREKSGLKFDESYRIGYFISQSRES
jgi:TPR repeat protein